MARIRIKVPTEPKVIEMPDHLTEHIAPDQPSDTPYLPESTVPQTPTPVANNTPKPTGIMLSKRLLVILSVGMTILLLFLTGVILSQRNSSQTPKTLGVVTDQSEPQRYYDSVSNFVELPTNELPTVANVSEAEKVKAQNSAFTDVKNGDKMLFFVKSRKVVVYRPDTNKVVAVISLAVPTETQTR